ncbi:MAG TPA: hypothetical protein VHL59_07320, partial [Thermoanaerobaculia bacterium]|nr:hypothetical protein [Thermoanaerobaculia bacterium]
FMTIRLESESGCVETKTFYVQNDIPACSVSGRVVNVAGSTTQLDIFIVNLIDEPLNIDNFTIAWRGQTGFAWNSITLPSGTVMTAPGTATTARAVTFTPGVTIPASDKVVPANGSLRVRMNFTATGGVADATTVTDFVLDYRRTSVGTFLIECSLSPLTRCSVTSKVTAVTGNQFVLDITITNSSVEELSLSKLGITWAGQNKLQWTGITLRPAESGPTIAVSPTLATDLGGARTFTLPAGEFIPAGGTYVVRMNLPRTQSGAQQAETTRVSNVVLEYTTEGGGTTALTCRAQ